MKPPPYSSSSTGAPPPAGWHCRPSSGHSPHTVGKPRQGSSSARADLDLTGLLPFPCPLKTNTQNTRRQPRGRQPHRSGTKAPASSDGGKTVPRPRRHKGKGRGCGSPPALPLPSPAGQLETRPREAQPHLLALSSGKRPASRGGGVATRGSALVDDGSPDLPEAHSSHRSQARGTTLLLPPGSVAKVIAVPTTDWGPVRGMGSRWTGERPHGRSLWAGHAGRLRRT